MTNDAPTAKAAVGGARPSWACVELMLAGTLIVASLTVPHVVFSASTSPWLAGIGLLLLWRRGPDTAGFTLMYLGLYPGL